MKDGRKLRDPSLIPGTIVIVDEEFANGGYEAKVVRTTGVFTIISNGGNDWSIMTNRLRKKIN